MCKKTFQTGCFNCFFFASYSSTLSSTFSSTLCVKIKHLFQPVLISKVLLLSWFVQNIEMGDSGIRKDIQTIKKIQFFNILLPFFGNMTKCSEEIFKDELELELESWNFQLLQYFFTSTAPASNWTIFTKFSSFDVLVLPGLYWMGLIQKLHTKLAGNCRFHGWMDLIKKLHSKSVDNCWFHVEWILCRTFTENYLIIVDFMLNGPD